MKNKEAAYQAWLGYYNSVKNVGKDKYRLVELANEFSRCMGLDNPPAVSKLVLGKMGLRNIPGLRSKWSSSFKIYKPWTCHSSVIFVLQTVELLFIMLLWKVLHSLHPFDGWGCLLIHQSVIIFLILLLTLYALEAYLALRLRISLMHVWVLASILHSGNRQCSSYLPALGYGNVQAKVAVELNF